MGWIRKYILKLIKDEIRLNGFEIDGYKVEVDNGTFTIRKQEN